jgi:hypothetical protein
MTMKLQTKEMYMGKIGVDFRKELLLDKNNLDQCALDQPDLFAEWATQWANAVHDRDRAKDSLALARSQADADIRSDPKRFGWPSDKAPTEAFVSSAIVSHPDYVEANEYYMTVNHSVNVLHIAKESFEQRRKMIEVLTNLYTSSYFSGNKAFDKGYQTVMDTASVEKQNEGLENSPRLQRRRGVKQ